MRVLALGLAALALPTLLADAARAEIFRDSDGDVISVLDPVKFHPVRGGGVILYYARGDLGPIAWSMGSPLEMADGQTLTVEGVSYQVESEGDGMWLRDPANGRRYAVQQAAARPDAAGRKVNPKAFALD